MHGEHEAQSDAQEKQGDGDNLGEYSPRLHPVQDHGEQHGRGDEQYGGGGGGAVGVVERAVGVEAVERGGHDIRKGSDDQNAEQPAEEQEQHLARPADVFLDDQAQPLALAAHGSEQGGEVLHRAEKYAPDDDPDQHRPPAEHGGDNRPVDRPRPRDGGELMTEENGARRRHIVHAVIAFHGRCHALRVHSPYAAEPAAVKKIGGEEQNPRHRQHQ